MIKKIFALLPVLVLTLSCNTDQVKADLILINSIIWTGNPDHPSAEAMAIKADTIVAIGSAAEIQQFKGAKTKIIDTDRQFVTPGFIDAHVHLLMGGNALLSVALRDVNTQKEFISRIASYAQTLAPNEWIVEGNWDHTLWGGELPSKTWIDEFTQNNPVAIYRMDGHMILANSVALKIAGIDEDSPAVPNGEIVRNPDGTPTGILKSEAMYLVLNKIPPLSQSQKELAIQKAQDYLVSQGVTSIHDVDSLGGFAILQKMQKAKDLKIRIYAADPLGKWNTLTNESRVQTKWLKNGLLKGFVDGSLGSHTAAFLAPYTDKAADSGIFINDVELIYQQALEADRQGLQITVHAIGDKANKELLDTYQKLIKEQGPFDRRLRIEHAQHLAPEDIPRFSKLKVIASVQPYHAIDDGRWAEELIGPDRIRTTYAFNSLLQNGAMLTFGSDWPVAPASPLLGIYAATTRRTLDGQKPNGWIPKEKIKVEEALLAYTRNAAYSSFDEKIKGTLEVGKLADFVVMSQDLRTIEPETIKDVTVLQTYVGGKKVFDSGRD